ncbi:MAG: glyoxalase superfamily protein [Paracoccaceae bacterium]
MKPVLPSIEAAKTQAKALRARLETEGVAISHGKALELVAHQYGYRDWNTLHAAIGNRPPVPWKVGDRVRGRYLGQGFVAEIVSVERQGEGWFRLSLELDEAVDVVTFDSFSNYRKRVSGVVGPGGLSREKTSDGHPVLEVEV